MINEWVMKTVENITHGHGESSGQETRQEKSVTIALGTHHKSEAVAKHQQISASLGRTGDVVPQ